MSGCYFVANEQGNTTFRFPLPRAHGSGSIKFGRVIISVFAPLREEVSVGIHTVNGTLRTRETVSIDTIPTVVAEALPGDGYVELHLVLDPHAPFFSALVEYETPGDPGALI